MTRDIFLYSHSVVAVEDLKLHFHRFRHFHDRSLVSQLSFEIVDGPESHQLTICKELIPFMNYLVASDDQIQAHLLDKLVYHIRSKAKGHTPVVLIPTRLVLRVGPHEITKQTFLRHLTGTLQLTNTVEVPQLLREPAADAKDLLSDQGGHREAVEHLYESFPKSNVCTPFALIIEAIDPGHRCVFVVASEKLKAVRILHLAQKQKRYGVKAPPPPVDIATQEQITAVRQLTESLKEVQELIVVAMHIAHNNPRGLKLQQHWLCQKDLLAAAAEQEQLGSVLLWNLVRRIGRAHV